MPAGPWVNRVMGLGSFSNRHKSWTLAQWYILYWWDHGQSTSSNISLDELKTILSDLPVREKLAEASRVPIEEGKKCFVFIPLLDWWSIFVVVSDWRVLAVSYLRFGWSGPIFWLLSHYIDRFRDFVSFVMPLIVPVCFCRVELHQLLFAQPKVCFVGRTVRSFNRVSERGLLQTSSIFDKEFLWRSILLPIINLAFSLRQSYLSQAW